MTHPIVEYRPMASDDLPQVLSLLKRAALPVDGVPELGRNLTVAVSGGVLVGAAGVEIYGRDALLRSVVVAEESRASGVGSELVRLAIEEGRRQGARRVYLLTETAADYFAARGFRRVSRDSIVGEVTGSAEFSHLCPSSAVSMVMDLDVESADHDVKRAHGSSTQR